MFTRSRIEWPTWLLLLACYSAWLALIVYHATIGWVWLIPVTVLVALHSSLQHEALHGHPTRSKWLNELLVFPALGCFIPYRRFRTLHLQHHHDQRLTDPHDDPESWYQCHSCAQSLPRTTLFLLNLNRSFMGRLTVGPALSLFGFWKSEALAIKKGDKQIASDWAWHILGTLPVLAIVYFNGVSVGLYVLIVCYFAMSLLMVRTFIEHRAADAVTERTAIVEAGWFMSLLFLNNNLHAAHHRKPALAWYKLPAYWSSAKDELLCENAHYHFPKGYLDVATRWLLKPREPLIHPSLPGQCNKQSGER